MATQETPVIAYRGAWDEELALAPLRHLEPREGNVPADEMRPGAMLVRPVRPARRDPKGWLARPPK